MATEPEFKFRMTKFFKVDWDKVQTVEDIKAILAACQVSISADNPHFDAVKNFLTE